MKIFYFGYNAFIIESGDKRIAFDPGGELYFGSRFLKSIIPKSKWHGITHIFVTHGDSDHHWYTDKVADKSGAAVICSKEMVKNKDGLNYLNHPRKKKIEYTLPLKKLYSVAPGKKIRVDDIEVAGIKTIHGALRLKFGPSERFWAPVPFVKVVKTVPEGRVGLGSIGFQIHVDDKIIVNLGDTLLKEDDWKSIDEPDVLMLPIGGEAIHNTMNEKDALRAVELLRPKLVIPCHYNCSGLFYKNANPADDEFFKREVDGMGSECAILKVGESVGAC